MVIVGGTLASALGVAKRFVCLRVHMFDWRALLLKVIDGGTLASALGVAKRFVCLRVQTCLIAVQSTCAS